MGTNASCPCGQSQNLPHIEGPRLQMPENIKEQISQKDILYTASSRSESMITKIVIIKTSKLELFFNSLSIFLVNIRSGSKVKSYFFDNIHLTNLLENENYTMIYMQSNLLSGLNFASRLNSKYKLVQINFTSNSKDMIKSQIENDIHSMGLKNYHFKGIIKSSENCYQMLFASADQIIEEEKLYTVEVYESRFKNAEFDEIKKYFSNNKTENFGMKIIAIFHYQQETSTNNYFFCIYEQERERDSERSSDGTNSTVSKSPKTKLVQFERDQSPTELYIKKVCEDCNSKGLIQSVFDTKTSSYIVFN